MQSGSSDFGKVSHTKPVPEPDALSADFWSAARRHVLAIQRCLHCGRFEHPPVGVCQGCRNSAPRFSFEPVSGNGTLKTWTIVRDSFIPSFREDVPFAIGLVELVERKGLRLIARLVDGPDATYRLEMDVSVVFQDVSETIALPQFKLRASGPTP